MSKVGQFCIGAPFSQHTTVLDGINGTCSKMRKASQIIAGGNTKSLAETADHTMAIH